MVITVTDGNNIFFISWRIAYLQVFDFPCEGIDDRNARGRTPDTCYLYNFPLGWFLALTRYNTFAIVCTFRDGIPLAHTTPRTIRASYKSETAALVYSTLIGTNCRMTSTTTGAALPRSLRTPRSPRATSPLRMFRKLTTGMWGELGK